jgi:hypothetical protein
MSIGNYAWGYIYPQHRFDRLTRRWMYEALKQIVHHTSEIIICKNNILSFKTTPDLSLVTVVSTSKLRSSALANMTIY